MSQTIPVSLGDRSYSIHIEPGLLQSERAAEIVMALPDCRRVCLVTHPALDVPYAMRLRDDLTRRGVMVSTVHIPPGERQKNLQTVARLYTDFVNAGLDRKSVVIALGGGVPGDLVGFAAASYLRGVRLVQVPTTLLAQVDSSVGGKTGVDLPEGKNLVGAFHQPQAVLIDPRTLHTLPRRELIAGLAEVIKYGIIYDRSFFQVLTEQRNELLKRDEAALSRAIARSCEIKAEVVSQDETEQGLRAILNFGHTVGHAIESVTQYRRYRHGEAIAIGMVSAALIGEEMALTPPDVTREIAEGLRWIGLPTVLPADLSVDDLLAAMQRDKKTEHGSLRFVLAKSIGEVVVTGDVPAQAVRAALARHVCL